MGTGASALENLPDQVDKDTAKLLLSEKFDEAAFDAEAKDGSMSKEDFVKLVKVGKALAAAKAEAEQAKAEAVRAKAEAEQAKLEMQRLKLALEAALGRAENPGIVARAAAKVKWPDDEQWVTNGMPIHELDELHGVLLLALKEGRMEAITDTSVLMEAAKVVEAVLKSFGTAVLATVNAGAWRLNWIAGLLTVLLCGVKRCRDLRLLAIKGGAACDCEIKFIEALMEELGAEVEEFRQVEDNGERIDWCWYLKRKGADTCIVNLTQFQKVEYATVPMLQDDFLPQKAFTHAPNLRRVAVVSAPVVDKEGEPIAQKLNENVSQALENAKGIADKKGFVPDYGDFKHLGEGHRDAWMKAYIEYTS